ncbi:molybdenum cofactor guanylyltransferase [Psychromonas marina]|uniref:Molybdenum cofactor guanylyltransferase n=1 Tax=Psychromonas marina TaxID=88364 RepID=A0ABQ6E2N9_9GAMM|nr:molybdenum cofactor guanylyltransferase [Psychromonas marina]GLS91676.1 molybdenum cofactor guanylyltransferase [Psychromonas marina]
MKIAGIILAGGLSSRMGQDKAQLLFAKQTLLARNVSLLSGLGLIDTFVSGKYPNFQCIEDINLELGPIGGLHACVEFLYQQIDALFIVPVDMPLLSEAECHYLLQQFVTYPQGVFYEQATFPMILPLNLQLKEYLSEALASPHNKQRSLYRLLKTLKLQPINYQTESYFRFQNSNTPEEWENCLATYHALKSNKEL